MLTFQTDWAKRGCEMTQNIAIALEDADTDLLAFGVAIGEASYETLDEPGKRGHEMTKMILAFALQYQQMTREIHGTDGRN